MCADGRRGSPGLSRPGISAEGSGIANFSFPRYPPWYRDDAEIVLATSVRYGLEGVVGIRARIAPWRAL